MTSSYAQLTRNLNAHQNKWLITGAAGFIGSHLLETLLKLNQKIVGLDNFSTGKKSNLDEVHSHVSKDQWARFEFMEGDICDADFCQKAAFGADFVLHEAALVSVPLSIEDPLLTYKINVEGFLNLLIACRNQKVRRFVYASSSAVYGDDPLEAKVESSIGRSLSPYAATKYTGEIMAGLFAKIYGLSSVGLRYFNVYGPRQDPQGAYAAVVSRWIEAMVRDQEIYIFGTGEATRDFCSVADVVQANLLAATTENPDAVNQVYNVACGRATSLNSLHDILKSKWGDQNLANAKPVYKTARPGDILHSKADISKITNKLKFLPSISLEEGIGEVLKYFLK